MNEKNRLPDELNLTRLRFYETDFKALDSGLTEKEQAEWNAIYASYRSSSILSGEIIGVEGVPLPDGEDEDGTDGKKEMPCLTVVQYRVKVLIPEPFVWKEGDERETYVLGHMAGAKIDYIITGVDREGQCAVASRALAMERQRWHAHRVRGVQEGDIVDCMVLAVGASHLTLTTCGHDLTLAQAGLSYSYLGDMRESYYPGQKLKAKVMAADEEGFAVSVREAEPNPYIGAEFRHPVGSTRIAKITNKYTGGIFGRLRDGCTVVCRYAQQFSDDQFEAGDSVIVQIMQYSDDRQWLRGKIKGKIR